MPKRRTAFTLTQYPYILEGLALDAAKQSALNLHSLWGSVAASFNDPEQVSWWITKPMTALAYEYAPELPEWDYAAVLPSRTGILIWDGGSGIIETSIKSTANVEIVGMWWAMSGETLITVALARPKELRINSPAEHVCFTPLMSVDGQTLTDAMKHAWQMFGASLILSQTETVATSRPYAPGQLHRTKRPDLPIRVTQVTLRQRIHRAVDTDHADSESAGKKWALTNRHLVRGHWRQQAVGPQRSLRRPVFVPPYIKGPEDGDFIPSKRVHVWRR